MRVVHLGRSTWHAISGPLSEVLAHPYITAEHTLWVERLEGLSKALARASKLLCEHARGPSVSCNIRPGEELPRVEPGREGKMVTGVPCN